MSYLFLMRYYVPCFELFKLENLEKNTASVVWCLLSCVSLFIRFPKLNSLATSNSLLCV